ncbi:putative EF-hand domain pair protein CML [Helianthus annuus]|uniref:EF-hand domain pair protein CML n=1 Tax=Helianthus annuus TaxID=4232 RepID=A0A251T017_HELAN|nr:probable calcium-binding protein CML25 [Helianthus annuus]KAF5777215.1 putative EF-hand domain pair protein CML [Helianthus annuus]KAJ0492380.1 putative EF-hand domain-containing protein [Helianthus annuus]KAJ0504636.1 putative EF-hand domain-containing protein [Helianthus annuus]KAJ0674365.1 putative EF-hand domain-containing protein [Helianthus annuus]
MGLKNLFNRKTKKIKNHKTTDETNPTNNTTPPVISHEQELEQVFNKFDVNGDGKISSSELGSIMGSMGHQPTPEELENMIMQVDADGDGFIDLKEFIELNTKDVDSNELLENLKEAFLVFDVDKNGSITADELQKVLGSLGEECTVGECRKMIAGVDQDGDGMISFDEFKVMMMSGSMFNDLI